MTVQSIITDDCETITNKSTIVEKFNIFFYEHCVQTPGIRSTNYYLGLCDEKFTNESFMLQPVSETFIFKQLKDLKVKKATGLQDFGLVFERRRFGYRFHSDISCKLIAQYWNCSI